MLNGWRRACRNVHSRLLPRNKIKGTPHHAVPCRAFGIVVKLAGLLITAGRECLISGDHQLIMNGDCQRR